MLFWLDIFPSLKNVDETVSISSINSEKMHNCITMIRILINLKSKRTKNNASLVFRVEGVVNKEIACAI